MLEAYLTEIIGAVSILVVIIIYIIIKKSKSEEIIEDTSTEKESTQEIETEVEAETEDKDVEDPFDTEEKHEDEPIIQTATEETTTQDLYPELISGTEEGSFGVEQSSKTAAQEESKPSQKSRPKRDVPPHGKITKENFKEFAGIRILVAEDNLINQKVISGLLADTGIEITIADDGQDALDILEKDSDFAFILMDAHMPRVDGFEATRIIRQNPEYDQILVVALSGDTAADDIKKMRDAGMEEQLEKPLRMDALYDILYAYTVPQTDESDSDEYIEVVMTEELNGNKGLEICGGDENFYNEILDEFVNSYSKSAEKLNNLIQNKELEHADRFLLDIVGITANIGADALHDIAQKLKEAIQNTQSQDFLRLLKEYEQHLTLLLKDIKEYKQ